MAILSCSLWLRHLAPDLPPTPTGLSAWLGEAPTPDPPLASPPLQMHVLRSGHKSTLQEACLYTCMLRVQGHFTLSGPNTSGCRDYRMKRMAQLSTCRAGPCPCRLKRNFPYVSTHESAPVYLAGFLPGLLLPMPPASAFGAPLLAS